MIGMEGSGQTHYACGETNYVDHSLICKMGGYQWWDFTSSQHKNLVLEFL